MNNKDIYKKTIDQIHADDSLKNSTFEKIEEKQKTRHPIVIRYLAACAVFIVLFSVGAFYFKDGFKRKEKKEELQIAQAENVLSRFENIDQIREILKENELSNYYTRKGVIEDIATENAIPSPATGSGIAARRLHLPGCQTLKHSPGLTVSCTHRITGRVT